MCIRALYRSHFPKVKFAWDILLCVRCERYRISPILGLMESGSLVIIVCGLGTCWLRLPFFASFILFLFFCFNPSNHNFFVLCQDERYDNCIYLEVWCLPLFFPPKKASHTNLSNQSTAIN